MKKFKLLLLNLVFINFNANAIIAKYDMKKSSGHVKFFALGNPSAIHIDGTGEGPEGRLEILADDKNSKMAGQFVFNLNTLNSGVDLRDSHMKEKYLEIEKFPTAKLTIETLNFDKNILKNFNKNNISFSGVLNLHGKEKAISGVTEFISSEKDNVKITAKFKIKPTDFNIEIPNFAGITVADEIDVEVQMQSSTKL